MLEREARGVPEDCLLDVQAFYRGVMIDARSLGRGRQRCYAVGFGAAADAPVGAEFVAGGLVHELVTWDEGGGGRWVVHATGRMTGELVLQGAATTPLGRWVEERGPSFALPEGAAAAIACGEMMFVIRAAVEAAPRVGARPLVWRWRQHGYLFGAALGVALVALVVSVVPPDARALSLPSLASEQRLLPYQIIPVQAVAPPARASAPGAAGGGPPLPAGGPDGRPRKRPRPLMAAARAPAPVPADAEGARRSGLLGLLEPDAFEEGSPLRALFSRGSALDAETLTGLSRVGSGEEYGEAGTGLAGIAVRPGGPGRERLLGSGGLGTVGRGPGLGPGVERYGADQGRLARRQPLSPPPVVPGEVKLRGSLDREIVRRVVRQHLNEIRHCYQSELPRHPDLQGRVTVQFAILPTGQVAASSLESSSLGNARVELCVVQAVRRWTFPTPAGGGMVVAIYPFNFFVAGR
jgi:TonB family protein